MLYRRIEDRLMVESECEPEFSLSCELLVAGLGTAGAIAAVTGAKEGLDTIGVESLGSMGGIGTAGCVWDYSWGNSGGRFEVIDKCAQESGERFFLHTGQIGSELGSRFIHGSAKSCELMNEAKNSGCRLIFGTAITGVFVEGDSICGVECVTLEGKFNISVKVVIDSTGDLFVARSFGLKTHSSPDSVRMNFSKTMVVISGTLARNYAASCGARTSELNDDFKLSEKLIEAGSRPGFLRDRWSASNRIVISGELPGYRDSERIHGLSEVSLKSLLSPETVSDPLFYAFSPIDHVGGDMIEAPFELKLWRIGLKLRGFGLSIPVPIGTLIPDGVDNLLIAGKGISISGELAGCLRMKKDMEKFGEAAAVIASIMIRNHQKARDVRASDAREKLRASGCFSGHNEPVICRLNGFMDRTPIFPPQDRDELIGLLSSPGFGTLAILALKGEFDPSLIDDIDIPEVSVQKAIIIGALGLFGRPVPEHVLETLRILATGTVSDDNSPAKDGEDTRDPDTLLPAAAVWMLGELRDPGSVGTLEALERAYSDKTTRASGFMKALCRKALEHY